MELTLSLDHFLFYIIIISIIQQKPKSNLIKRFYFNFQSTCIWVWKLFLLDGRNVFKCLINSNEIKALHFEYITLASILLIYVCYGPYMNKRKVSRNICNINIAVYYSLLSTSETRRKYHLDCFNLWDIPHWRLNQFSRVIAFVYYNIARSLTKNKWTLYCTSVIYIYQRWKNVLHSPKTEFL